MAVAERARQRHLGQRTRQRARQCSRVPSTSLFCCLRRGLVAGVAAFW